jgi:hypothetical protein
MSLRGRRAGDRHEVSEPGLRVRCRRKTTHSISPTALLRHEVDDEDLVEDRAELLDEGLVGLVGDVGIEALLVGETDDEAVRESVCEFLGADIGAPLVSLDGSDQDASICSREMPRSSKARRMVASMRLAGQEAPAVTPMTAAWSWRRKPGYWLSVSAFVWRS